MTIVKDSKDGLPANNVMASAKISAKVMAGMRHLKSIYVAYLRKHSKRSLALPAGCWIKQTRLEEDDHR